MIFREWVFGQSFLLTVNFMEKNFKIQLCRKISDVTGGKRTTKKGRDYSYLKKKLLNYEKGKNSY